MADVIATIWDFDKTLIPGYMQDPIFEKYGVEPKAFWDENNREIQELRKAGFVVNQDTFYLNRFIRMSAKGQPFDGLNNDELEMLGKKLRFCEGAIELFRTIKDLNNVKEYDTLGIRFENYIVSTGFKRMIEGSDIAEYVEKIWGAEVIDKEVAGVKRLTEIAYSLDNTTKTRAIFEINKGVGIVEGATIDVNTKLREEDRRVRFCNMVYVADGPSDVPAFSLVNQKEGATLAVYPKGDAVALHSVERLRREGRVQMIAENDYKLDGTAAMWIIDRLRTQADSIVERRRSPYTVGPGTPAHITK